MTSWKKKIKQRFGRHSGGDVSPPATLIDDLPPPFARSMSLRHPGFATRDGDLRPDSFLLLDDQRVPTLRRTWSFRQAVAKPPATAAAAAAASSAFQSQLQSSSASPPRAPLTPPAGLRHPQPSSSQSTPSTPTAASAMVVADSYQNPVILHANYTGTGSVPECPPSPTKPAFFSRLFRFSLRDKHHKHKGVVLPPSVAHVDVIRTGDPEQRESRNCRDAARAGRPNNNNDNSSICSSSSGVGGAGSINGVIGGVIVAGGRGEGSGDDDTDGFVEPSPQLHHHAQHHHHLHQQQQQQLSQWPSVQSDILIAMNDGTATSRFISQWASVPTDMTSAVGAAAAAAGPPPPPPPAAAAQPSHGAQPQRVMTQRTPLATSSAVASEWSSVDNAIHDGHHDDADANDAVDDEEDPDVVVIRRCTTLPSFRIRSRSDMSCPPSSSMSRRVAAVEQSDSVDSNSSLPLVLKQTRHDQPPPAPPQQLPALQKPHEAPMVRGGASARGGPTKKIAAAAAATAAAAAASKRKSREVFQDELKFVLLNGTYPPKADEVKSLKPNGLIVDSSLSSIGAVPHQLVESPCSDDSAVGDLSPVNNLVIAAAAATATMPDSQAKFTVDSAIFGDAARVKGSTTTSNGCVPTANSGRIIASNVATKACTNHNNNHMNNNNNNTNNNINSNNNRNSHHNSSSNNNNNRNNRLAALRKPIGPTIELEDPKTTRRRFESRLPNSCRPASVSPVRDPAVIRRVKKNTIARPVSYTPGLALMQRASTDLSRPLPLPATAERASSAEPLVRGHHSAANLTGDEDVVQAGCCTKRSETARRFGSMQDVRSRPSTPPETTAVTITNSCGEAHAESAWTNDTCVTTELTGGVVRPAKEECSVEDTRAGSRVSGLSDEVDSGTFVRKKPPVPLTRSGTFTKDDSTTPVEDLPVVEASIDGEDDKGARSLQREQPARKSLRRELRKPSEVAKVAKELIERVRDVREDAENGASSTTPVAISSSSSSSGGGSKCKKKSTRTKPIVPPMKLDLLTCSIPTSSSSSSAAATATAKDGVAHRDAHPKASKLPAPGSFVRGSVQNSSRRRIALPASTTTTATGAEMPPRSGGSTAASPEAPEECGSRESSFCHLPAKELASPGQTPKGHQRSRCIVAPTKISRAAGGAGNQATSGTGGGGGRSRNSGLRLVARSPVGESVGQPQPSPSVVDESAEDLNRTFDVIETSERPSTSCAVTVEESGVRLGDETCCEQLQQHRTAVADVVVPQQHQHEKQQQQQQQQRNDTAAAASEDAMTSGIPLTDLCGSPHSDDNGLDSRNGTKAVKSTVSKPAPVTATTTTITAAATTTTTAATPATATFKAQKGTASARVSPSAPTNGQLCTEYIVKAGPTNAEIEHEILRLGEACEARTAELNALRGDLRRSSVAFGAMTLAAQYWSDRLRRTEDYSLRLKGQLQIAEKVILKAHSDIETLQKETSAQKEAAEKSEQAHNEQLAELEKKHAAAIALLHEELRQRLEAALEKERQRINDDNELVPRRQLEQLTTEHGRTLERLQESHAEEIRALADARGELERRLADKSNQCRRVEDEAAALKAKLLQTVDARAQWLSDKVTSLEKEVESLNAVLEMKTAEVRELMVDRRENQERKERMASMQEVIDKHRARIEDLTAQLDRKTEVQQKLTTENVKLNELSEKKDRIIHQMNRDFEELKYRMTDSNSFTVNVSTPMHHRPLRESKSVSGAGARSADPTDEDDVCGVGGTGNGGTVMSRSWHVSFGNGNGGARYANANSSSSSNGGGGSSSANAAGRRRPSRKSSSSSSESKASDEESRAPTVLNEVFLREDQVALEEAVSGQIAVSKA